MPLFDDAMFSPQTYSGGLLGALMRMTQGQQAQNDGYSQFAQPEQSQPSMQPQTGPTFAQGNQGSMGGVPFPIFGQPQQADQAAIPANAQPTQGQYQPQQQRPPQQPQQQSPFSGMGDALGGVMGALMPGRMKAMSDAQMPQVTQQMLTGQGMPPQMARVVASNPALLAQVVGDKLGIKDRTNDIKEFEYAKSEGFKGSLQDWMANKRAGAGEYGLQAIWGKGPDGNPAIIQLGKAGKPVLTPMPEGFQPNKDAQKVDLGTHWGILDPTTRQLVTTIPKDLKGAESQKAQGEAQGKIAATLPTDILSAEQTTKQIDDLLAHNGLDAIVGPLDQFRPSFTLGAEGRDALARYNQLKGKAFLQAYSTLRGGGAITEVEGTKAENAMARMDRAQGESEFRNALKDFRDAVRDGLSKLKERGGATNQPAQAGAVAPSQAAAPKIKRYNPTSGMIE